MILIRLRYSPNDYHQMAVHSVKMRAAYLTLPSPPLRPVQFTQARPECVSGVVFIGSSSGVAGKLENFDLPCLVIRGSRDPCTPEKVGIACVYFKLLPLQQLSYTDAK